MFGAWSWLLIIIDGTAALASGCSARLFLCEKEHLLPRRAAVLFAGRKNRSLFVLPKERSEVIQAIWGAVAMAKPNKPSRSIWDQPSINGGGK